jgi:L-amino acid N-acyltransferase YncA
MENSILIDGMLREDWEQVRKIYLEGIATGNATFQKEAPSWEEWNNSHIKENVPSLKLHRKYGFREVGRRERIGKMDGVWRDTILLERRSTVVGTN